MISAVLDSNIIVSAVISRRSSPRRLFEAWRRGRLILVTSAEMIAEVTEVLQRSHVQMRAGITDEDVAELRHLFEADALIVEPNERLSVIEADPDDDRILECAMTGGADYIASGDRHLLSLGQYAGIKIVTAAELADILEL